MTLYAITCDGPGPHIPASGVLGSIDRATAPKAGEFRCGGANCTPPPQTVAQTDDDSAEAFIRARFPAVLAKAKAIMADPAGAPDLTAMETKVLKALVVLDLAKRFR
jgi:hypothetical protein